MNTKTNFTLNNVDESVYIALVNKVGQGGEPSVQVNFFELARDLGMHNAASNASLIGAALNRLNTAGLINGDFSGSSPWQVTLVPHP